MKILIVGGGGREHAVGVKLKKDNPETDLFFAPGNAGTLSLGQNIPIKDTQLDELKAFVNENNIDLTIVGPEAPLVLGIVDAFEAAGYPIIGPSKEGAQLEGSKKWAKAFMTKHGIPTADYQAFQNVEEANAYLKEKNTYPIVIKADGLAAGKGVTVAQTYEEAKIALNACFIDKNFGDAGAEVVIEDFLKGEEASIFAFTDGKTIVPMVPAQDHKAIYEGDKGPNTGGMGAYSPTPLVTKEIEKTVYETVFLPLLEGFKKDNISYKGIVYAGLMIENGKPAIVEFNVRFGDPETQVVLPRLKTNLLTIFKAITNQTLDQLTLEWTNDHSVCVVLASGGYPGDYKKNQIITLPQETENTHIIHAGTTLKDGELLTSGGRVLGVVSNATTLDKALKNAYATVDGVHFDGMYCRRDIGWKARTRNVCHLGNTI